LELCYNYSRGTTKIDKGPRDILERMEKIVGGGVTSEKIGNMLDYFNTDILSSLSSQLDTLQMKKKEEMKQALVIFCPKFRMKHTWKECPLD
jgi:hypothetical protein